MVSDSLVNVLMVILEVAAALIDFGSCRSFTGSQVAACCCLQLLDCCTFRAEVAIENSHFSRQVVLL